ncbi:MAG: phosphoribosyltransferase family protein [Candidatus Jordarchaeaceae archaeon]
MKQETHALDIKRRMKAVELLKILKKSYTYEELSKITKLPITVLNRYVKVHVLPSKGRAEELFGIFDKTFDIRGEVSRRIKFDGREYFDNTELLGDILLMRVLAETVSEKFSGHKITKVLTAAVDGIPIATQIANQLEAQLIIAKRNREVGVSKFVEESYVPSSSGVLMTLYLPKGAITSKDRVLIVDDIIRSGETQRALVNIAEKSGAKIVGIFFIISIGRKWEKTIRTPPNCTVEIILQLPEPSTQP